MKTQSAKAKGRRFQQWVRDKLVESLGIHPEDIESRSMGAGGEDLIMARAAREKFPYSIECKNQETLNVWKSYEPTAEIFFLLLLHFAFSLSFFSPNIKFQFLSNCFLLLIGLGEEPFPP
jgi:hypothetical protein